MTYFCDLRELYRVASLSVGFESKELPREKWSSYFGARSIFRASKTLNGHSLLPNTTETR